MSYLALEIPDLDGTSHQVPNPLGPQFTGPAHSSLGYVVTQFLEVVFVLAGFLMFIWFVWGVFRYMLAQGKKDDLGKAKDHMRWAIVGFILFMLAFFLGRFAQNLFPQVNQFYKDKTIPISIDTGSNPAFNLGDPTRTTD